jgi:hypothetical protein
MRGHPGFTLVIDNATFDGRPPPSAFSPRTGGGQGYAAIVDEAGAITWQDTWYGDTPGDVKEWTIVDLDGDGSDEIVEERLHIGHMASSQSALRVLSVGPDGVPVLGGELPLHDSLPKARNSCGSTHRLVRSGRSVTLEIAGTRETDPQLAPVDEKLCPREGRHRYRWRDSRLVESR